ncbi:MAG: phospholipase D family protein [Bacteroidales bacterium]
MLDLKKNYIDFGKQLQPPHGFQIDYAVATTYSLDLYALLSIPLAMYYNQALDSEVSEDNFQILESIQNLQKNLKIFCHKGKIAVPKSTSVNLIAFIENCVNEYLPADANQSFHPKVWVLRFKSTSSKEIRYRLIVMSRNLTFDKSYDIAYTMEGSPSGKGKEQNEELVKLMKLLDQKSTFANDRFIHDLSRVSFELCTNFESYDFSFFPKRDAKLSIDLKNSYNKRMVVSPFLSDEMVNLLKAKSGKPLIIFSRKNELNKLSPKTTENTDAYYFSQKIADHQLYENIDEGGKDDYLFYEWDNNLHAKLYLREDSKFTYWDLGSANCSNAAFYRNVEFMIHLKSKYSELNIDNTQKALLSEYNGVKVFQKYVRSDEQSEAMPEEDYRRIEFELIKCLEDLNRFKAYLQLSENSKNYDLYIEMQLPTIFDGKRYELQCCPVGIKGEFQKLDQSKTLVFPEIHLYKLSSFIHWQIKVLATGEILDIVSKASIENMPEHRLNNILKSIIDNPDKFMQLLSALLADQPMGANEHEVEQSWLKQNGINNSSSNIYFPVYEELLINLSRSPERLLRLSALIEKLNDFEDQQIVPKEFTTLWNKIKEFLPHE